MDPLQFHWVVSSLHIKQEPEQATALISPPATPNSFTFSSSSSSSSSSGLAPSRSLRSSPSLSTSGRTRPRPYPPTKPAPISKKDDSSMSQPPYTIWSGGSGLRGSSRSISAADRRSSDGERQPVYSSPMVNDAFMLSTNPNSSLIGVMGEPSDSHYSRVQQMYPNSPLGWNTEVSMMSVNPDNSYPGVAGSSGLFSSLSSTPAYDNLEAPRNASPESIPPPHSPPYCQVPNEYIPVSRNPYRASSSSSGSQSPYGREDPESEILRLRKQVQELQQALVEVHRAPPSSLSTAANLPPAFRAAWKRRTDARKKLFCSLNRAGNALCAWHDSRRERRQFPPRNAPPGYLNCGCTHEEALFEESLSRHAVGGYLPGENVRMDPELRRPLLRLLQKRYGYKDGDFDFDPQTLEWHPEQDPESWERQAHSGGGTKARRPDHSDRH